MKKVIHRVNMIKINDILDLDTYNKKKHEIKDNILVIKERRRIHVGPFFTFLFENKETLKYQIQEMLRIENITNEKAILHEIDTYNKLLPNANTLSATLLIEIQDSEYRAIKLKELLGLEKYIFLNVNNSDYKVKATFDEEQFNEERLSSVQFLKFTFAENILQIFKASEEISLDINHPYYTYSQKLSLEQLQAIKEDICP